MTAVGRPEFERAYREALAGVWPHWNPGMQAEMARHCHGWSPERFDFRAYLEASVARFHEAYVALAADDTVRSVCDVGGFWGVFPLTLRRLGYTVAMTESLQYYSAAFRGLFDHVAAQGVEIVDYDPFAPGAPLAGSWDAVTVMAVLEHYPHSLRAFMENVVAGVRPGGLLFVEVPNIAFWPKRVSFLRGHSPHTPIGDVYRSAVPFIGHHHEFTMAELRELAELAGLHVEREHFFNYSPRAPGSWKQRLVRPVERLAFRLFPDSRECLAVTCRRVMEAS